jgi:hypothetical protein
MTNLETKLLMDLPSGLFQNLNQLNTLLPGSNYIRTIS